jgi:hypothetical protein
MRDRERKRLEDESRAARLREEEDEAVEAAEAERRRRTAARDRERQEREERDRERRAQLAAGRQRAVSHLQGVPKVPHTFVFAISSKSLDARKKCWCQIQKEGWEILYVPSKKN